MRKFLLKCSFLSIIDSPIPPEFFLPLGHKGHEYLSLRLKICFQARFVHEDVDYYSAKVILGNRGFVPKHFLLELIVVKRITAILTSFTCIKQMNMDFLTYGMFKHPIIISQSHLLPLWVLRINKSIVKVLQKSYNWLIKLSACTLWCKHLASSD